MNQMEALKLELVRPGPLHGQLLSKLTNYIALCDGVEADTVRLPFDHHELEDDLQSMRYYVGSGQSERVPNNLRAIAVEKLSRSIANVIDPMRSFQTRFAEAVKVRLIHLRLVLGGSELSLIPFELATLPPGWRGAGRKLSLQASAPVVLTRELRDSNRIPIEWDRRPRILFCTASPAGFAPPPVKAHLLAITRALRPWIKEDQEASSPRIDSMVTVLENASLESIERATRLHEYTHVHFLCHGARLPNLRDRYGVALADSRDPAQAEVVDAQALSHALWGGPGARKPPTMVVFASCDSANQSAVHAPGSSVAYELHQAGVPWVIASQMPLTFQGSATLARVLYEGLLGGVDPRDVLNEVRHQLARDDDAHDWASVVAYAAFPPELTEQIRSFRIKQLRGLIESAISRIYKDPARCDTEHEAIKRVQLLWADAVDVGAASAASGIVAEYLGMRGATAKQVAAFKQGEEKRALLREAAAEYAEAVAADVRNHWVAAQNISLGVLLGLPPNDSMTLLAEGAAGMAWQHDTAPDQRGWAAGTLLELALLKPDGKALGHTYQDWAQTLRALPVSEFVLFSTKRQLKRYLEGEMFGDLANEELRQRAQTALDALGGQ